MGFAPLIFVPPPGPVPFGRPRRPSPARSRRALKGSMGWAAPHGGSHKRRPRPINSTRSICISPTAVCRGLLKLCLPVGRLNIPNFICSPKYRNPGKGGLHSFCFSFCALQKVHKEAALQRRLGLLSLQMGRNSFPCLLGTAGRLRQAH